MISPVSVPQPRKQTPLTAIYSPQEGIIQVYYANVDNLLSGVIYDPGEGAYGDDLIKDSFSIAQTSRCISASSVTLNASIGLNMILAFESNLGNPTLMYRQSVAQVPGTDTEWQNITELLISAIRQETGYGGAWPGCPCTSSAPYPDHSDSLSFLFLNLQAASNASATPALELDFKQVTGLGT